MCEVSQGIFVASNSIIMASIMILHSAISVSTTRCLYYSLLSHHCFCFINLITLVLHWLSFVKRWPPDCADEAGSVYPLRRSCSSPQSKPLSQRRTDCVHFPLLTAPSLPMPHSSKPLGRETLLGNFEIQKRTMDSSENNCVLKHPVIFEFMY